MATQGTITEVILDAIAQHPGCLIEELTQTCPAVTWNQVFVAIDQLSRTGHVQLRLEGRGLYRVWCRRPNEPPVVPHHAARGGSRAPVPVVAKGCAE